MKKFLVEIKVSQKALVEIECDSLEDAKIIVEGSYCMNDFTLAFFPSFEESINTEIVKELV